MNRQPRRDPYKFVKLDRDQIEELAGKGELILSCGVANVKVEMNGEAVGKTDQTGGLHLVSVNTGYYMLLLSHPHYLPTESLVNIKEWRREVVTLTLMPRARRRFVDLLKHSLGDLFGEKKQKSVLPGAGPRIEEPQKTESDQVAASGPSIEVFGQVCGKCERQLPIGLKFCTQCGALLVAPDHQIQPPDAYKTAGLDDAILKGRHLSSATPSPPEAEVIPQPVHKARARKTIDRATPPEAEVIPQPVHKARARKTIDRATPPEAEVGPPPVHEATARETIDRAAPPVAEVGPHPVHEAAAIEMIDRATPPEAEVGPPPVHEAMAHETIDRATPPEAEFGPHPVHEAMVGEMIDRATPPEAEVSPQPVHKTRVRKTIDRATPPEAEAGPQPVHKVEARERIDRATPPEAYIGLQPGHEEMAVEMIDRATLPEAEFGPPPVHEAMTGEMIDRATLPEADVGPPSIHEAMAGEMIDRATPPEADVGPPPVHEAMAGEMFDSATLPEAEVSLDPVHEVGASEMIDRTTPPETDIGPQPVSEQKLRERENLKRLARPIVLGTVLAAVAIGLWIYFSRVSETFALAITTSPPNCKTIVDGRISKDSDSRGQLNFDGLSRGEHELRVSKPGYQDRVLKVMLPLERSLEPVKLDIAAPEGMAYIEIEGRKLEIGGGQQGKASWPRHKVAIEPFFIDKTEVTRAAYRELLRQGAVNAVPAGWTNGDFPAGTERLPMTGLNWQEAGTYCQAIGKRLPKEEEWEAATRNATGQRTFGKTALKDGRSGFSPVGRNAKDVSPFGVFDLLGNAWEWTESDFTTYSGSRYRPRGCEEPRCKVIRGGSILNRPSDATIHRFEYEPTVLGGKRNGYANTGFRCAKSLTP